MIRSTIISAFALLVLLGTDSLKAATPVAIWKDFNNLISGSYTWTKASAAIVNDDGSLTVGADGGLSMTFASGNNIYNNKTLTLVMDVTPISFSALSTLVDVTQNENHFSLAANGTSLGECWNTNDMDYAKRTDWMPTAHQTIAFVYKGVSGIDDRGTYTYINGASYLGNQSCMTGTGNITQLVVGSYNKKSNFANGLIIHGIALFETNLTAEEIASYKFPIYWIGGEGEWVDETKWSNGVPSETSDVIIPANAAIVLNENITINSLNIKDVNASIVGTGSIKINNLADSTLKGTATIVFDGTLPDETTKIQLKASTWTGTAWIKNYYWTKWSFEDYGNKNSFIKLTGVSGYIANNANKVVDIEVILADVDNTKALTISDGFTNGVYSFRKISGTGTITTTKAKKTQTLIFKDVSTFEGKINSINNFRIVVGDAEAIDNKYASGSITFADGVVVKAGLGWEASSVVFGKTIKILNAEIDQVLVTGVNKKPTTLAGVTYESWSEDKGLAIGYADNVLKIVKAQAQVVDEQSNIKNYDLIESAINNEATDTNEPTVKILKGAEELKVANLAVDKVFKLDANTKQNFRLDDRATDRYLAFKGDKLVIASGTPANATFTNLDNPTKKMIALGLDASDENDRPFIKQVGGDNSNITFGFFHGVKSKAIVPTGIGDETTTCSVEYSADPTFSSTPNASTAGVDGTVSVPVPSDIKVLYYRPKFNFE